ncbi:MAG: LEA type 2 family protein [Myxococcales bacterium]|nr:LEA type 2 family protein [Myxococcales bacterium]
MMRDQPALRQRGVSLGRAVVVCSLLLTMPGCALLNQLGINLDAYRPKVAVEDVQVAGASWDAVDLTFVLRIDNPNPLEVKMAGFSYALSVAEKPTLSGDQSTGVALKANGPSRAQLPLRLQWKQLIDLGIAMSRKKSLPYVFTGSLGFQTPIGLLSVPLEKSGTLPTLQKPSLRPVDLRLGKVDLLGGQIQLLLDIEVSNRDGGETLAFSGFDFRVDLGGKSVASGTVSQLASVPSGQTHKTTLPIALNVANIGLAAAKTITGRGSLDVRLHGKVQVSTPLGMVPLQYDLSQNLAVR